MVDTHHTFTWFHLLCSYSCFQLVGNTQGCGLCVRLDRLRGRLLSLFLQCMWFFLCVPTCNFITWLLFHSGFYCTFYYRSLVGIGVSNWRASFCRCNLPVKNRYWGGQQKLVKSVHRDEASKDAWCRLLKKPPALLFHAHPEEGSKTLQPRQKASAWKSLQAGWFYYPNWVTHS